MSCQFRIIAFISICFLSACSPDSTSKRQPNVAGAISSQEQTENPQHLTCAQETCGQASKLPFFTAPIQNLDSSLYRQYLDSSLRQFLNLEGQSVETKNKLLTDFSNMKVDRVSDAYLAFINLMYFYSFGKPVTSAIEMSWNRIKIDINVLRKKLNESGLTRPEEVNWVILIARTIYESDIFYANYYLSQFPLEIFVQKVYPNLDTLTAISREAQSLEEVQNRFSEAYPMLKSNTAATLAILKKAINKEPLAPDEKQDFIEIRMSLLSMREILPGGKWRGALLQRSVNIPAMADDLFKRALNSTRAKISGQEIEKEKRSLLQLCAGALVSTVASSPTPEQNLRFTNLVRSLKSDAKSVLSGSRYHSPQVMAAVDKVHLILPPTKQQTAAALARSLQNEIAFSKESIERMHQMNIQKQEDKELVLLMLASQYMDDDEAQDNQLSDVKDFCEENMPEAISDASYSRYQLVNVGWRSVLYPQFGYGIAAHELAHVISEADSFASGQRAFTKVKDCLKDNQSGKADFVEEDFADLFASQLMKSKPDASNYSCLLLNQKNSEYADLAMTSPKGSEHSSGFYRLIAIGTQLNNLTPTCQAAKQNSPSGQRIRNCWGL